jgi:Phytanoyl-CoA dioxygenase (PhyH)
LAAWLFETYGTVQIDNAFPVELIQRLQAEFMERYSPYFHVDSHPDALRLGDKRYMLTVDMDDPFDDPGLLGAPMLLPIISRLLGDDCVLGAFTAVISLPGSQDQRLHKDHPALFPHTEWHFTLPCFAAQIIIPLVPLDEFTGTTRFYKGTHRVATEHAEELGAQDPMVPLGSCVLNDYRCAHRGLGNRSQVVRPILTLIYNRPWFRDFKNYGRQPPLRLGDAAYARMPPNVQPLVAWWKNERRLDQLDHSQLIQPRELPSMANT